MEARGCERPKAAGLGYGVGVQSMRCLLCKGGRKWSCARLPQTGDDDLVLRSLCNSCDGTASPWQLNLQALALALLNALQPDAARSGGHAR